MTHTMRGLLLLTGLISLIAGSLGCATMAAVTAATDHSGFYNRPVLADRVIAIGRPAPELMQQLGHPGAVAFIGEANTYLIYQGGDELEKVAHLRLDWSHLNISRESLGSRAIPGTACGRRGQEGCNATNHTLYLRDQQFWGTMLLVYDHGKDTTASESVDLVKAGFHLDSECKCARYLKEIAIAGMVYPPLQLSENQLSRLGIRRPLEFYNPRDAKPPTNFGAALMVPVAVVADIVLIPVYLGMGAVVLVGSAVSG